MKLSEYQIKALETCAPRCSTSSYLRKGLIGETGEIFDKLKRIERGDCTVGEARLPIAIELGDLLWYVAVWAGANHTNIEKISLSINSNYPMRSDLASLDLRAEHILDDIIILRKLPSTMQVDSTLIMIEVLANALGYSMEEIAKINNDKLSKRQKNGTIQGTGDNR